MFSYFGSKSKIVHLYPKPLYDHIIEPFAGSARYACRYGIERDVTLCDAYPVIARIWKWIINATPSDIRSLPELKAGERVSDCKGLSQAERDLVGFTLFDGVASPRKTCGTRAAGYRRPGKGKPYRKTQLPESVQLKTRLLKVAGRISHWKIVEGSYEQLENVQATWFVDPPYRVQGKTYKHHGIDYSHLGNWCRERRGQVIVCEGIGADWLPFLTLTRDRGNHSSYRSHKFQELIWYKSDRKPGFGL